MSQRLFNVFKSLRLRRTALNPVNGAPNMLRPGELAVGESESALYFGRLDSSVMTLNAIGATGPAGPTGSAGLAGPTGSAGPAGSSAASPTVVTLSYSATLNTDAALGDMFDVVLTGNATLANPTNATNGRTLRWRITQDGTGSRAVTLGDKFVISAGSLSPLPFSTLPDKTDMLAATYHAARDKWDVVAFVYGY